MTEGESIFYLREITSQWSPSNLSPEKLAELAAGQFIEIHPDATFGVRLTGQGARRKALFRQHQSSTHGISLTRAPTRRPGSRKQHRTSR